MIFDFLICLTTFFFGFHFPNFLNFKTNDLIRLKWLWCYHLVFGFIYYFYVLSQGGSDSLKYWAEQILQYAGGYNRKDTSAEIIRAGYDVKENARWLENFYLEAEQKQHVSI